MNQKTRPRKTWRRVAAATIAAVLLFLTEPLRFVPVAALGAVLIFAAFSLFDVGTLREIWRYDRLEVGLSLITTLGVVAVGAINGVLIAVAVAMQNPAGAASRARRRGRASAGGEAPGSRAWRRQSRRLARAPRATTSGGR